MVTPFFRFTLTPYHNSDLLQVGLISGSIVTNMILHNCIVLVTAAVVVTISLVNPSSQHSSHVFTVYLVLSRFSVGRVLYITCIPLP
jgi:hypothetical protein